MVTKIAYVNNDIRHKSQLQTNRFSVLYSTQCFHKTDPRDLIILCSFYKHIKLGVTTGHCWMKFVFILPSWRIRSPVYRRHHPGKFQ